ncbi:MAG: DUF885 domain-containing protein [Bacteroidota bacterium]
MYRYLFTLFIGIGLLAACQSEKEQDEQTKTSQDTTFNTYKEAFVEELWATYPTWASYEGFHKYDSVLRIPNEATRNKEIAFVEEHLKQLAAFDIEQLSDNNQTDFYLIENQLKKTRWQLNDYKAYQWNPSNYNVSGTFAVMLINDYDALETRLQNFHKRLQQVPAYYAAAKENIQNPTEVHTQLAIEQNLGGLSVFEKDLPEALTKSNLSETQKQTLQEEAETAVAAINDYVAWLKALPMENPRSFRLGEALYEAKFNYNIQSGYSAEEIYQKAQAHKKAVHQKMIIIADTLWGKYLPEQAKPEEPLAMVRQLIDKISLKHVAPDSFQLAIEAQIPELEKFIKEKDLLTLDPTKPLKVRREPDYMAGVAGASISAPGPYDKEGNTYYNVGSLAGWSPERAESYLREYNHYILQILNIHEAIPGHYTQLVYSNQSPSIIKAILGNGAMIEGWAVYTELMMLENGYGNHEPELWLMYYKWNLRSTCNTILDYAVHTQEMTKEKALDLLTNEAFQQQAEAEGKWRRVRLTSVQLTSYFTGYQEIYDFREEMKDQQGDNFDLKAFHEQFLGYGSAPVKYIKAMMTSTLTEVE